MTTTYSLQLPMWAIAWLIFTGLINLWDPAYVFMRPDSMVGGKYEIIWRAQQIYSSVDKRYASLTDPWVIVCATFNVVEAFIGFFAVLQHFSGKQSRALITAFSVSLMTLFKTTIYYVIEHVEGWKYTIDAFQNDYQNWWLLFNVPNFFWFLFPTLVMITAYSRMTVVFDLITTDKKKR